MRTSTQRKGTEMMLGIWHYSFHVSDLDRSIRFYTELLTMELVHTQNQSNEYTRRLVGFDDAELRVAQLRLRGIPTGTMSSHVLELVEYVTPRTAGLTVPRSTPGTGHLAFAVDDIWGEYRRLLIGGVEFVSEPNAITAGANEGGAACYFVDPDDITLELLQPPPRSLSR